MLKQAKIRSKKHRMFIASLPCLICKREDVQCAHIRYRNGGGLSMKPCDSNCVPLCVNHHQVQGQVGEKIFWSDRIDDAKGLAKTLFKYSGNRDAALMEMVRYDNR